MVCLDTDFLVALLRGDTDAYSISNSIDEKDIRKVTTPINAFELFLGANISKSQRANLIAVGKLLSSLELLDFDLKCCENAGSIAARLRNRGETIGIRDTMIAGIASRHEEPLLTRNVDHFSRVRELKLETW